MYQIRIGVARHVEWFRTECAFGKIRHGLTTSRDSTVNMF